MIQIGINRLLDFLCDAPLTRDLPGIRYLAPYPFEQKQHHFTAAVPLDNVRTSDLRVQRVGDIVTVSAASFHENGEPKLHWSEGTSGYGTWQRRYRLPIEADANSLRVIPGPQGIEIVVNGDSSTTSLAA